MNKSKIEWCDYTVNPVVGCRYGCRFCYARRLNDRFKWIDDFSEPRFFPERLEKLGRVSGKAVFLDSMSDVASWPDDACLEVSRATDANPGNCYMLLTKQPEALCNCKSDMGPWRLPHGEGVHYGTSVCDSLMLDLRLAAFGLQRPWDTDMDEVGWGMERVEFLSVEPLLGPLARIGELLDAYLALLPEESRDGFWFIIGPESGNDRGKVECEREWVDQIVRAADERGCKVFMKERLREIVGDDAMRKEFPAWHPRGSGLNG